MKQERLARIIGLIDDDLIAESGSGAARKKLHWGRWAAAAACLCVAALGAWAMLGGLRMGAAAPGESGIGVGNETVFMSYAGPVLPLTLTESAEGLMAERNVTLDVSGSDGTGSAVVTDSYVLTNSGAADVTCTAVYPFTGSLRELERLTPALTVDGVSTTPTLYTGGYSGGFRGAGDSGSTSLNLNGLDSWEGYKALLANGSYREAVFTERQAAQLAEPVVVYELTNGAAPEGYNAATMAIRFQIDPAATQLFTYGINGGAWGDDGSRRYSYFVGAREQSALLIVLGADIGDYTLQGYEDGGCDAGEELDFQGSASRREMTLGEALAEVTERTCAQLARLYGSGEATIPDETLYCRMAADLLLAYGPTVGSGVERYGDGRLDDLFQDAWVMTRVLYLAVPVTIPAGESVTVTAAMEKDASFDFGGARTENQGVVGYDLVTALDSNLPFTAQTAALEDGGTVEIVRQNFGFDLENGVRTVSLDVDAEHYYLELRRTDRD